MIFRFFNSHSYFLSSVAFRLSKELNDALWFAKSCFERVFSKADICLWRSIGSFVLNGECSLIYNRFDDTFIRQRTQFFIVIRATAHVKAIRAGNCRQRGFVVSVDSLLDVWHTAVADLDCITVEYFV
jgi:hypothetical protein